MRGIRRAGREDPVNEKHQARRQDVVERAAEIFAREGFSAGTTKDIAAAVGLSQPAIYHYVGSKQDILREIALSVDETMTGALQAGLGSSDSAAGQLRAIIREFTAAVIRARHAYAVFWQELKSIDEPTRKTIQADERKFIGTVAKLVAALQEQGRMPPGPPTVLAQAILGMPSWMYRWYQPRGSLGATEMADLFCALLGLDADSEC